MVVAGVSAVAAAFPVLSVSAAATVSVSMSATAAFALAVAAAFLRSVAVAAAFPVPVAGMLRRGKEFAVQAFAEFLLRRVTH